MQLIQDKLTIPHYFGLIPRPRLMKRLTESLNSGSATVIYARAGLGKTALVTQLASEGYRRTAWFKIDSSDSDWRTFFRYLASAIDLKIPGFGRGQFAVYSANATLEDMSSCAEFLLFDLADQLHEPLAIVFEDLHLIFEDEWVEPFFSRFLSLLPANVHVVITSRSRLPAPLWRMRSKQLLCVIDESELLFTLSETEELCRAHGLTEAAMRLFQSSAGRAGLLTTLLHHVESDRVAGVNPLNTVVSPFEKRA